MFTAMLRQCGYRNYIPILVHNKPNQLNTKQEEIIPFFKIDKNIINPQDTKEKNFNDVFKFLDIPNGTYIH